MSATATRLNGVLGVLRLPIFCWAALALASGRLDWGRLWLLAGLQLAMIVVNLPPSTSPCTVTPGGRPTRTSRASSAEGSIMVRVLAKSQPVPR